MWTEKPDPKALLVLRGERGVLFVDRHRWTRMKKVNKQNKTKHQKPKRNQESEIKSLSLCLMKGSI